MFYIYSRNVDQLHYSWHYKVMAIHTTDPIPQTTIDNPWRGKVTIALATVAVGIATTMVIFENPTNTEESNTSLEIDGPNPSITSLTLEEGAAILHEPSDLEATIENSPNLIAITDKAYSVDTINGVDRIYTYHEGWVGMSQITASEYTEGVMDPDGIVWVDGDKVELTEDN